MPLKPFKLDDVPLAPMAAIYGPSGAGKTTLISTMPGIGIYIDVPTLEEGGFVISEEAHRIHGVRCEEWEDIDDIYWALKNRDTDKFPEIGDAGDPRRARWFALDSISGMHTLATRKVIGERDRSLGEGAHMITLQERGWISQLEAEMIFRLRSLSDYWQIMIAQERSHGGDDDPAPRQLGPDLPGGSLRAFKQCATIVGRLGVITNAKGKEERQLRVGPPDGDFIVKYRSKRSKRLPNLIRDPDLGNIFGYIFRDGPMPKAARDPLAAVGF